MSRILVAEDERRIASFIDKGLRAAGYAVTVVADGSSAYDHAVSGRHDLLVLDVGLPLMDGFAVLRRLREARNPIPVIILTARDSVGDTVAALEGGADDYMAKPFQFEELLARIRLRRRRRDGRDRPRFLHRRHRVQQPSRHRQQHRRLAHQRPDRDGQPAGHP